MKERLSSKQAIFLMLAFLMDGALILPTAPEAGRNLWIAILVAIVLSFILFTFYTHIQKTYFGKDFYSICQSALGKPLGNAIILLYVWYFLHLGALTLRDFGEFMSILTMPETPKIIIMIISMLIGTYMVKKGIEVMGRFALFASIFTLLTVGFLASMLTPKIDIKNVLPIMAEGAGPILQGAWSAFTFPFGECVIFLVVLANLNSHKAIRKTYYGGLTIGGALVFITSFYEISILGEKLYQSLYFPAYMTLSRVKLGEFIQRLEIVAGINFNVFGIIKISLCIYAASVGISRVFKMKSYKNIALPVGLLMLNLSVILYEDVMQLVSWTAEIYKYYALPFQVFIPVLVFIVGKIRKAPQGKA